MRETAWGNEWDQRLMWSYLRQHAQLHGAEVPEEAQQELLVEPDVGAGGGGRSKIARCGGTAGASRCDGRQRRRRRLRRGRRQRRFVHRRAVSVDLLLLLLLTPVLMMMMVVVRRRRRRWRKRADAVRRRSYYARYRASHAAAAAAAAAARRGVRHTGSDVITQCAVFRRRGPRGSRGRGRRCLAVGARTGTGNRVLAVLRRLATKPETFDALGQFETSLAQWRHCRRRADTAVLAGHHFNVCTKQHSGINTPALLKFRPNDAIEIRLLLLLLVVVLVLVLLLLLLLLLLLFIGINSQCIKELYTSYIKVFFK